MPPILALGLCILFVAFLLRIERRQATGVSSALWIPTAWMLVTASKPLGLWLPALGSAGSVEAGSAPDRLFLTALLCLGLMTLAKRGVSWGESIRRNPWASLLIFYMLISVLWSGMAFVSFKRWTRELIAFVMALVVASENDPKAALISLFRKTIYILIPFSPVLIKYYPEYGVDFHPWTGALMWIGVTTHKNSLGRLCLFTAFFLIWTFVRRKQGTEIPAHKYHNHADILILALSVWLMKGPPGSYSATSMVTLAGGLICFFILLWLHRRHEHLNATPVTIVVAVVILYGTATPMLGQLPVFDISSALGRNQDLTGRAEIWAGLVPLAMQHPILGAGFGGFWTDATRDEFSAAHNGYLDIILHLGFVGLTLFATFLISCSRKAQRIMAYDFDWGAFSICIVLMVVLHNVAESSISSFATHLTAILLFIFVAANAVDRDPAPLESPS